MKKRVLSEVLMCMAIVISLGGCGGTAEEAVKKEAEAVVETVVSDSEESNESHEKSDVVQETLVTEQSDSAESVESSTSNSQEALDGDLEKIENLVMEDVEGTIDTLLEEYELLLADVDTYESYMSNTAAVEGFYEKVYVKTIDLGIRLREYSVDLAEEILASDKSFDEKYDDFEIIYDCLYEDAGDDMYDEIYNGILDDMYDDLYAGVLDDGYDNAEYSEWYEARSNEYEWWSDTRSEVYDEWSDCRSDIYDFWSDMRGEMWDDDIEKAYKKLEDFVEDIEKLESKGAESVDKLPEETEEGGENTNNSSTDESAETDLIDGMRPDFKEAMDSYETFYEEYCDFMEKYNENPSDLSLIMEYTEMLARSTEMSEKFEEWNTDDLNDAEMKYYMEVNNRVAQMLVDVAY